MKKTTYTYTPHGQVEKEDVYDANEELAYSLEYEYDNKGRLIRETNPLQQDARYQYDANGNCTFENTFSGVTTRREYDRCNRITLERVGDHQSKYAYNTLGQQIAFTDYLAQETTFSYDPLGNTTSVTRPDLSIIHYEYDGAGHCITETDACGNITQTQCNCLGNPLSITYPDNTIEQYTYTLEGHLTTFVNPEGTTVRYNRDALGRELTKTLLSPSGEKLYHEEAIYSAFHLIKQINALGVATHYTYNLAGQLIEERVGDRITLYDYDPLGG